MRFDGLAKIALKLPWAKPWLENNASPLVAVAEIRRKFSLPNANEDMKNRRPSKSKPAIALSGSYFLGRNTKIGGKFTEKVSSAI